MELITEAPTAPAYVPETHSNPPIGTGADFVSCVKLGIALRPEKCIGAMDNGSGGACVLGAAAIGAGIRGGREEISRRWPWMTTLGDRGLPAMSEAYLANDRSCSLPDNRLVAAEEIAHRYGGFNGPCG